MGNQKQSDSYIFVALNRTGYPVDWGFLAHSRHDNEESTDEDLDVGDDSDLESDDPLADEDSNFDDFDDEFDDDFQEEESDPDWEHPDDLRPEAPPPSKSSGKK